MPGSTRVVLVALAGNLAVAVVKFAAFALTRSTAMLSEGVHSLVDTADQLLLLVGEQRAARPPDESHPFGYGMEMYFWSFIVALLIFFAGGAAAIWEGVAKLIHPAPVERPWIAFAVLGASAVFEGLSLRTAYGEYRAIVEDAGSDVGVLRFIQLSKDPSLFTTLLEDGAALAGLLIAALGTAAAAFLGFDWADGAASVAIGVLLLIVAAVLTNETRSLIAGERAAPSVRRRVRDAVQPVLKGARLTDVISLQLGPRAILVFLQVAWPESIGRDEVRTIAADLTQAIRAIDPRIVEVAFLGPDVPRG
jgi:cation diffusion facilitator family transporter